MSEPLFKVGDLVVSKAQQRAVALTGGNGVWQYRLVVMHVIAMIEETCSGGMQRKYSVSMAMLDGLSNENLLVHEHEIEAAPLPSEKAED